MKELMVSHRSPSVAEYQQLRHSAGWSALNDANVKTALSNSLFSVCVMAGEALAGSGRIIGDGAVYFYLQDVIVLPEWQGRGVGVMIMEALEQWLAENAPEKAFIGLMAAAGVQGFYHRFGYQERPDDRPGMYKVMGA